MAQQLYLEKKINGMTRTEKQSFKFLVAFIAVFITFSFILVCIPEPRIVRLKWLIDPLFYIEVVPITNAQFL